MNIPTDAELAAACRDSYLPASGELEVGRDLAVLVRETNDSVVVAFRGTTNLAGWLRDLDALPTMHERIGTCHSGFLAGASALWARLDLPADRPIVLTGHSLGGALAILVAALRTAGGDRMDALVTFGAPRAGYKRVRELLAAVPDVRQYRRGFDPVPEVPVDLPAFPYKHAREPLLAVGKPDTTERWRDHSIAGYVSDVGRYLEALEGKL